MIPKPHGGKLIDRYVKGKRKESLQKEAKEIKCIKIDPHVASEVRNIANGTYSPLEGFLTEEEYESILESMRLTTDIPWTIPIIFDLNASQAKDLRAGDDICLEYNNKPVALLRVEEVYTINKEKHALKIYGTRDPMHPGVKRTLEMKEFLVGGKLDVLEEPRPPFQRYALSPKETRILFIKKGWNTIAAFQTRNVPHRGHEFIQKSALTFTDGLLVHPLVGWKKRGDYKDEVIIRAYDALIRNYFPPDTVVFSVLWMQMRYAGPREAVHHAIVRKNYGATHFIVGRDHAGVGKYYGPYDSWKIFEKFPDLGITPLFIKESFYCSKCGGMATLKTCPHPEKFRVYISGTKIRDMLSSGIIPPETMMRKEVAEVVLQFRNPFVE